MAHLTQYVFGNFRCPHTPLPTWWQGGRHGDNATISAASSPHHPGRIESTRSAPLSHRIDANGTPDYGTAPHICFCSPLADFWLYIRFQIFWHCAEKIICQVCHSMPCGVLTM
jgi:hypothetical protein